MSVVETYRGCDIYWDPSLSNPWYSPCVPGEYFWSPSELIAAIDAKLAEEPEEDYWEHDSYHRGIEILRWMPGAIAYGAWIDDDWVVRIDILELQGLIDDWLGPLLEPFTVIDDFVVPDSLLEGSDVNVRVLLRNTGDAGYLNVTIIGNPYEADSYTGVESVRSPTQVAPGSSVWLDIYFRYNKMPSWDFNLTANNEDETSQISKTIALSVLAASAYIYEISYWIEGVPWGTIWSDPTGPVPVPPPNYSEHPAEVGEDMYLSVGWHNTGDVAILGHVDLRVTSPSGAVYELTAYAGQDKTRGPGSGAAPSFISPLLNEEGTWRLKATLSHAGGTLDEETTSFNIAAPARILISLTIDAPASVAPEETFWISGILYETDTGVPIPGQTISLSYSGPGFTRGIGNVITGVDGDYLLQTSMVDGEGTFTLMARFAGTEGLQTSSARVDIVVAREVEPVHTLGIDAYPETGDMGDDFLFNGLLMLNGAPVPYETINLVLKDVGGVGSDTTDVDGVYEITWMADRSGSLRFHAEAPYLGSSSPETGVNVE